MSGLRKKRIQVEDNCLLDGGVTIDSVTGVELPEISWKTAEISSGYGMAGDLTLPTLKLNAMEMTVNTDSGDSMEQLSRPGLHNLELREAVSDFYSSASSLEYKSVKYRVVGQVTTVSDGSSKPGEAKEGSVKFSLSYYEKEIDGRITRLVDVANGTIRWDGVDYRDQIQRLLN